MIDVTYQSIMDNIGDGLYQVDAHGRFIFVNRTITERYGIPLEKFCTLHFLDIVDPEYKDSALLNFQRVMGGEDGIPHEIAHKDASGRMRYIEIHSSPIREGGKIVGLLGISRDITTRKQAEKALEESELRFRLAAESCADLIWEWDITIGELKWFGPIDKLLGYKAGTFPRTIDAWESIIHQDDHDRVIEKLNQHLNDVTPYSEEYRVLRRDGAILYWTDRGTAVRYMDAKPSKMIGAVTDITELKLAEERLKASEKQFRGLVELITIGIFTYEGTKFRYLNPACEKITGYTRDELLQFDVWDIVHPEFQSYVKEYVHKRQKGEPVPERHVFKIITKSGEERWVERGAIPIESYAKPSVLITVTDITQRKQAEDALYESEQQLQGVIDGSPIPAFVIAKNHSVMHWNKALQEMSRIKSEEILGTNKHWRAFYSKERPCMADLLVDDAGEMVSKWYPGKYVKSLLIKDGYEATDFFPDLGKEGRWLRFTAAAIRDSKGMIIAAIETLEDITERKDIEEDLRKSEQKYRSLLENASDAILIGDKHGNIFEANTKAEELLGYTREELRHINYTQLRPMMEPKRTIDSLKRLVREGYATLHDTSICRKDGKEVPVDITASVIRYGNMEVIQGLIRDITEHKNIESTLEKLVGKRTAEISEKNERLMMEMKERERVETSLRKKGDELKIRARELNELNSALKVLLKQRDEDKMELEEKVMANVRQLILPYLEELKKERLDAKSKMHVSILEANLNNITSSFTQKLSSKYSGFTPREIQVANLIRQGKSTKEMAEYMKISPDAIGLYRNRVRKKLGIISKKINLRSHLLSLS